MNNLEKICMAYFLIINFYGILIMYLDKRRAIKGAWRISEKHIFSTALFLGSIGIWIGMNLLHHKTKHAKFKWGIPVILVIQLYIFFRVIKGTS